MMKETAVNKKTEETHCIFNHINEEVSYRRNDAEGNTNNDTIFFLFCPKY